MTHALNSLADNLTQICSGGSCGLPTPNATQGTVNTILQLLFSILGAVALLVIVVAGLRYITSAGDPQKAANARSTIIFALVGLIVAISAKLIITFVVNRI